MIEKLGITPGPWEVTGAYKHLIGQVGNDKANEIIAELWNRITGRKPEMPGDAPLIAAAPEMLEALIETTIECMNEYSNTHVKGTDIEEVYSTEIHIIEKATGKSWEEIKELLND